MNLHRHHGWILALAFLAFVPTAHAQQGGKVEIKKGLQPGETVVVEGAFGTPDGAQVQLPGAK